MSDNNAENQHDDKTVTTESNPADISSSENLSNDFIPFHFSPLSPLFHFLHITLWLSFTT